MSAIVAAVMAPTSTAATSIATAVFTISLVASGGALRIVTEAFRLPAGKGIVAVLALIAASAFLNEQGLRAALPDLWAWRKLAFLYLALPLFVAVAWKRRLVLALFWSFLPMLVLSCLALAGWIPDRHTGLETTHGVVLTNHSSQGLAFAVAAVCGAMLAGESPGGKRWFYAACGVAFVVNILFFSAGRTGYLAVAGMAIVWAMLSGGWRAMLASVLGLVVLTVLAFTLSPTFKSRLVDGWGEMQRAQDARTITSIGIRVIFARNTLALIAERPLLGYGLGSFKPVYANYVGARSSGVQAEPAGDPHNQYLYVLFEQGALGLTVFLIMIVSLFATFPRDVYGRMAACILTAWCLTSVFSSHFRTFPEGHFYAFVVAGLGAAASRRRMLADSAREPGNRAASSQPGARSKVLEHSAD